jgi:hypothetical protein
MASGQMSVQFRVKYWTEWGQNLVVCGPDARLGAWDVRKGVWMHCQVSDTPANDWDQMALFFRRTFLAVASSSHSEFGKKMSPRRYPPLQSLPHLEVDPRRASLAEYGTVSRRACSPFPLPLHLQTYPVSSHPSRYIPTAIFFHRRIESKIVG